MRRSKEEKGYWKVLFFVWGLLILPVFNQCTPVVKEYKNLKSREYRKYFITGKQPVYRGDSLRNIVFPVGGFGTGHISLGGRADFKARASMKKVPDFSNSFFAIWSKEADEFNSVKEKEYSPVVKILEGKIPQDMAEDERYGSTFPGISRFRNCSFTAKFPFGNWSLSDRNVPIEAELEVFNPYIPGDIISTSLPVAIFHWKIINQLQKPVDVSLAFRIKDLFENASMVEVDTGNFRGMKVQTTDRNAGSMEVVIQSLPDAVIQTAGFGDSPEKISRIFWHGFQKKGIPGKISARQQATSPSNSGSIHIIKTLEPEEEWTVPFIINWDTGNAISEAMDIIKRRDYLYSGSRAFSDALFTSTYPDYVNDAVAAAVAISKHGVPGGYPDMHAWNFPELADRSTILGNYHNLKYHGKPPENLSFLFTKLSSGLNEILTGRTVTHEVNESGIKDEGGPDPGALSVIMAELKAVEDMAAVTGRKQLKTKAASELGALQNAFENELWNGEFYKYGELEACQSDQLAGISLACIAGIDSLLSEVKIGKALNSVYRYNYRENLDEIIQTGSRNLLNDEGGLLTCTWPYGNEPFPLPYGSDDVFPGKEYALAAAMIRAGMIEEGFQIVENTRSRYRGWNRNPWQISMENDQYPMTAWDLHLAISGYRYMSLEGLLCFDPKINKDDFRCMWFTPQAWGKIHLTGTSIELDILGGKFNIRGIRIPAAYDFNTIESISYGNAELDKDASWIRILLTELSGLQRGDNLKLVFR